MRSVLGSMEVMEPMHWVFISKNKVILATYITQLTLHIQEICS
jgi:hypothetical protein